MLTCFNSFNLIIENIFWGDTEAAGLFEKQKYELPKN